MFTYDLESHEIDEVNLPEGAVIPRPRNSHTLTQVTHTETNQEAYLFGGANGEGPLKDLYRLNLITKEFKQIKLVEEEGNRLPLIEMHSAEVY
jgi:hypothetical protein